MRGRPRAFRMTKSTETATAVLDPVCGMTIVPSAATAREDYQGETYYFCNPSCAAKFHLDPARYVHRAPPTAGPAKTAKPVEYTCPMHPEIVRNQPGPCPICGMALEPREVTGEESNGELVDMTRRFRISLALTAPILVLMVSGFIPKDPLKHLLGPTAALWLQFALSTPVVLWCGWPFFHRGWSSIVNRHLNMFTLIALGTGASYFYSVYALLFPRLIPESFHNMAGDLAVYFEPAAAIVTLVLLGQVLELRARSQTSSALKALLGLAPKNARVVREARREEDIPLDRVVVGDQLRVRPGEKVPVDGLVLEGGSSVDE